ncbi:MAG: nucleoside triphosphate pyrophosphohydrolase [Chloroflexi bacterium]|nr:nucleoside triphosphate pyrophosphohydrolase [Chloroflexota bacterium]
MTGQIVVVGLGPGPVEALTIAAVRALRSASALFVRTEHHPTLAAVASGEAHELLGRVSWTSFDTYYENAASFDSVYHSVVTELIQKATTTSGTITYAVPGHPLVGERTVQLLLEQAPKAGITVEVVPGLSSIEAICQVMGADPLDGLQVADAYSLGHELTQPGFPSPWAPLVILQVYSRAVASQVKQWLLQYFPASHVVQLVRYALIPHEESIIALPVEDLDHSEAPDRLCSIWVPPLQGLSPLSSLRTLEKILEQLRSPAGCPWDREQTHASLKQYLLEESFELIEALDRDDAEAQIEELGDVLLQIVFHAQIGKEEGAYDLGEVVAALCAKLLRRHPHVFGSASVSSSAEVLRNWSAIKQAEGHQRNSVLDGIPAALPALTRALLTIQRAASSGFIWADEAAAWHKLEEELQELRSAISASGQQYELGDVLFAAVGLGSMMGIDAEESLRLAAQRFADRFRFIERRLTTHGDSLGSVDLDTLLALWKQAKTQLTNTQQDEVTS